MSTIPAFPSSVQVPGNMPRIKTATAPSKLMLYKILSSAFSRFPPPYPHFAHIQCRHIQQPPCIIQSLPHSGHVNQFSPPAALSPCKLILLNHLPLSVVYLLPPYRVPARDSSLNLAHYINILNFVVYRCPVLPCLLYDEPDNLHLIYLAHSLRSN